MPMPRRLLIAAMGLVVSAAAWAGDGGSRQYVLAPGAPSRLDWGVVGGYWYDPNNEGRFLYLSPEGFIAGRGLANATLATVGKWRPLLEFSAERNRRLEAFVVMVSDEKWCKADGLALKFRSSGHDDFREIRVSGYKSKLPAVEIAVPMGLPPPSSRPEAELKDVYLAAERSAERGENEEWRRTLESNTPAWFQELVRRFVLSGTFRCE